MSTKPTSDTNPATADSSVPESLRCLAQQFSAADVHGVAPDLAQAARYLVGAAWDGTLCRGIVREKVTLADAVRRSAADLDAAAMSFMAIVPAEMSALLSGAAFDASHFARDVVAAFTNLKNLRFDGMRTLDYDNIQAALSKHEEIWRSGPHKNDVFVIQHFCLRMVELTESLRERTGARIANDAVTTSGHSNGPAPSMAGAGASDRAEASAPSVAGAGASNRGEASAPSMAGAGASDRAEASAKSAAGEEQPAVALLPLNYENSESIFDGRQWPKCVDGTDCDWALLFGPSDDDDDGGPWLTPRMAARIHNIASEDAASLFIHGPPSLPKVARPFYKNSLPWRLAFRDCYIRIALRLQKGLPPQPNCTGEEMAFHNIVFRAPDAELDFEDFFEALPEYPNDDDFAMVRDSGVEDEDVLMLFEEDDRGYDESNDDELNVDNPVLGPGTLANFMLGTGGEMMRTANLHPKEWFVAFRRDRFKDHL